jgi:hypothetical protein
MKNILVGFILLLICTGCDQGQVVPSLMYVNQLTYPKYYKVERSTNIFITCQNLDK